MAYEWDIFLSYPRSGQVGPWVHTHFLPVLRNCLDVVLADEPTIFVDTEQPTGVDWPEYLKTALLRSRIMVAVWTPPYFRSEWCMAEWQSMLAREVELDKMGQKAPRGLVYPVVYSDGRHFAPGARNTQYKDLSAFTYPYPGFQESAAYLKFHDEVMAIAAEIEEHLEFAPNWNADWPIVSPSDLPIARVGLAKL